MPKEKTIRELSKVILHVVKGKHGAFPGDVLKDDSLSSYSRKEARDVMQEMIEAGTLLVDTERKLKAPISDARHPVHSREH